MSGTVILSSELNSLLLHSPPEIFCKIWRETEIYDYEEIKKFAINNKNLIPLLDISLYRVDIDCEKSNLNYESLLIRMEELRCNSSQLKEINISNLNVKDIDTLLYIPNIKSVSNIHLDDVDHETTHSIFERIIELHRKCGEDFTFDVYYETDEWDAEQIRYQIRYDHGTLFYDSVGIDYLIEPSYLSQVVQQLRPHTIETYGAEITTALMVCDSIKTIKIVDVLDGLDRETVSFEAFIIANIEYMNIKHRDKKDYIDVEHDKDGYMMTEIEMIDLGIKSTLRVENCSVTTISHPNMPFDEDFSITEPYNYIYLTITKLLVPIKITQLPDIIEAYPNVETFYYYPADLFERSEEVLNNRNIIIQKLIEDYPNITFIESLDDRFFDKLRHL
jgi:hypothetical protein